LGYLEGKNLVIEYRYAEGRYDGFAAEVLKLPVDMIITRGTLAALAESARRQVIHCPRRSVCREIFVGSIASSFMSFFAKHAPALGKR
jgi:hypothetical protein